LRKRARGGPLPARSKVDVDSAPQHLADIRLERRSERLLGLTGDRQPHRRALERKRVGDEFDSRSFGERPVEDAAGALPAPVGNSTRGTVGSVASTRARLAPALHLRAASSSSVSTAWASARERHAATTISFAVAFARSTRPRCVPNALG
jgi:hypothetical protein